ncbi:MAG: hypothetical protein WBM24_23120 [Candidatus Sulfotelmatobacter sp.]
MAKRPKPSSPDQARASELVDFLQDVALGKRKATDAEVDQAQKEFDKLLPDAEADE